MCDSWLRPVQTMTSARLQQYFLPCTTYVWQLAETSLDSDFGQTSAVFLMCDSWLRLVLTTTSTRLQQYFLPCTTYVWQLAETCPDSDFDQTSAVFLTLYNICVTVVWDLPWQWLRPDLTLYNICVTVGWDLSWQRLRPDFSSISYLVQHMCDSWLRLVLTATSTRLQQYFLPCTIYVRQLAETCTDDDVGQILLCTTYVWQ